jgi:Mrp family chromosome partitioning ATPase
LHVVPPPAEAESEDDGAGMPFIEVGPSRSLEGSPDVLAFRPVPPVPARPSSDTPRVVAFRPLLKPLPTAPGIVPELIAFHEPGHAISTQYRELLGAILDATSGSPPHSLLFTGSAAGVGTSTVVLNLAVTAARQGRRVVIVDANARRPAIAARLALCDRPGLAEVLAGTATLDEALQESEQPGLVAITSGSPLALAPRAAESYRSLLRQLRHRFDLALLDGPRWDARPEVIAPGAACDATFLVLPAGADQSAAIEELQRQLPAKGVHLAGCVVAAR